MQSNDVIDGRYLILDEVGSGGMGVVFKTRDQLTNETVALKYVSVDRNLSRDETLAISDSATTDLNMMLASEFKIMASLRHPNILSVLSYGFHSGRPYFTMPLIDEPRNFLEATQNLSTIEKIDLLIDLLQALAYLHHRGIVHRDLKPSNVLVTPDNRVKLVDFGLATMTSTETEWSGTIAYTAPESIRGEAATEETDLFSIGIMAFEALTGKNPFYDDNISMIINKILLREPNWDLLYEIDDFEATAFEYILVRLLAKNRDDRYKDARTVMLDLCDACDRPALIESEAVRSSYLEAARFIGRESELRQLQIALNNTIQGQGSSWLIGGESGVGKSRLVDEVRVRAMVKGCLVCRTRANREDSSNSVLWQNILNPLLMQTQIEPEDAAVLKPLIPDIERFSTRLPLPVLNLQPEELQKRQMAVITTVLQRQTRPVLIIIEDLHWALEGLNLLQHINRIVPESPIMVIGNFRNDERPQLPSSLPEMKSLTIERFDETNIAELSIAMLGEKVGQHPKVINLLQRETEGNVFFVVQVLRTLTSSIAHLEDIDVDNLPDQMFVGGINEVFKRRLEHLPGHALPWLKLAAVIGRDIDHSLMDYLLDGKDYSGWLNLCHQFLILEADGRNWSFSHDKIRSYVQEELLDEAETIELHKQVAAAIESVYQDRLPYMYNRLAFHHEQAQQYRQAINYLEQSALFSVETFENQQALDEIAHIWKLTGKTQNDSESTVALRIARWERIAGEAKYAMRILDESKKHLEQALKFLDINQRQGARLDHYLEAGRTMNLLVPIYIYGGNWELALEMMQETLNIYERLGEREKFIETTASIPWLYYLRGYFTQAIEQFDKNISYAQSNNLAIVNALDGKALSVVHMGTTDDLTQARQMVETTVKTLEDKNQQLSNFDRMMSYATAASVMARNRQFAKALSYAEQAAELAEMIGNNSYLVAAGYASIVEAHLLCWEDLKQNNQDISKDFRKENRQALNLLHQYAQMVSIARPRAWVYQSWFYTLNDKPDKARQTLGTAISEAINHNMEYDEALAYDFLGDLLPVGDEERGMLLDHALSLFESLGAKWDADRTRAKLDTQ